MSWYELHDADASFFTTAPEIHRYDLRYAAPPQRVWESLTSDESMAAWGPAVKSVTWTSPRPFGVGTTRELALAGGAVKVRERFFRWDEGTGFSFAVDEASIPMLQRFAEDYRLEADGDGTRFTWTVAIEAKPKFSLPMRLLRPVNGFAFGRLAADGRKYFARHP